MVWEAWPCEEHGVGMLDWFFQYSVSGAEFVLPLNQWATLPLMNYKSVKKVTKLFKFIMVLIFEP